MLALSIMPPQPGHGIGAEILHKCMAARKPPLIATTTSARNTLKTLAAIGMAAGLADMILAGHAGKKQLPKMGQELENLCIEAVNYWGRIDIREGKNNWIPQKIAEIDKAWKQHRASVVVFVSMVLPMISDAQVFLAQAAQPDNGKAARLQKIEAILVKIFRHYEQRGHAREDLVLYGQNLYRKWMD